MFQVYPEEEESCVHKETLLLSQKALRKDLCRQRATIWVKSIPFVVKLKKRNVKISQFIPIWLFQYFKPPEDTDTEDNKSTDTAMPALSTSDPPGPMEDSESAPR